MKPIHILTVFIILCHLNPTFCQINFWEKTSDNNLRNQNEPRLIIPEKYEVFNFDFEAFQSLNHSSSRKYENEFIMSMPLPDGSIQDFKLTETPIFEEGLSEKYPDFFSFTGKAVAPPHAMLKMSVSPFGINAMIILDNEGIVYIDPYNQFNPTEYIVYFKHDLKIKNKKFTCSIAEPNEDVGLHGDPINLSPETNGARFGDCTLRTYRLALACTGEYAKFHGNTISKVLAAYNATMTRVNGIYERYAAITMKLIANTDRIIFLNPATDPYSNDDGPAMLDENQETLDDVIGFTNYDIGHVFSTGGGGIAGLRVPCSFDKARGVTGQDAPVGDPFDIDFVAHEMGHQFGANHTQNNECQRNNTTAVEPGSASSIMGYAGICAPNVQNNSDAHFHAISLGEIANFVLGSGNSCAVKTDINNQKPDATVKKSTYTLPISTSFSLTAQGQDADGDLLTYCWEQIDNETATMPPKATNSVGPAFRSLPPSTNATRYFPDLQRRYSQWEVIPSVSRSMDFRCTLRDNNVLGGCTDEVDVKLNFSALSGPFLVTNPNSSIVNWLVGSKQNVTWDVAKTDQVPVNCNLVNIILSVDGGKSYPHILAVKVPNTGSFEIETPNIPSNTAKIMIVAEDNIFFDVSNANFKITTSFAITSETKKFDICNENEISSVITLTKVLNNNQDVTLNLENPTSNLLYNFNVNPVTLPGSSILTISNLQILPEGKQVVKVIGSNSTNEKLSTEIELFTGNKIPAAVTLLTPENFKQSVSSANINFEWQTISGVKEYLIEISDNPSFTTILHTANTSESFYKSNLEQAKIYYWRVKGIGPCVLNPFSLFLSFKTAGGNELPASILKNEILVVDSGQSGAINEHKLNISNLDPSSCKIIITDLPTNGQVKILDESLTIGSTIKLADILSGNVTYLHNGGPSENDQFTFDIIDDKNRWLPNIDFKIIIRQSSLGIAAFTQQGLLCFGDANGIINVEGYGGQLPYTYSLDNLNFQDGNIFNNLVSGSYTIYIRDFLNTIKISNVVDIVAPSEIKLFLAQDKYDINAIASGGTGNLKFSLDNVNFSIQSVFTDPGNGKYFVYVKDEYECLKNDSIILNIPKLSGLATITKDVLCSGLPATIALMGEGGIPPLTYSVNNIDYQSNPSFSLSAGKYAFSIKDAGDKIFTTDSITTNQPTPILIALTLKKFEVTVMASGGSGQLEYSKDGLSYTTNNVFIFADNGSYKIYVRDANQCVKTIVFALNVLKSVNQTVKQITCYGKNDGSIKLIAANGTTPFQYGLNGSSLSSTREWPNLGPGSYDYVVKDSKNDSLVGKIQISEPDSLILDLQISGDDLSLLVSGGVTPYRYSIDGGNVFLDNNVFNDLPQNNYTVGVKDKNGCTKYAKVIISANEDIQEHVYFNISPNPAIDIIYVKSSELIYSDTEIKITTITGIPLFLKQMSGNKKDEWQMELNTLHPGTYVISIKSKNISLSKLFIKY